MKSEKYKLHFSIQNSQIEKLICIFHFIIFHFSLTKCNYTMFTSDKPIYLQMADRMKEEILSGTYSDDMRIPSVREYGATIGVNPNTVMRTYEKLTAEGVIYNKRGIGYFISPDAKEIVLENNRKEFMEVELPAFLRKMELLGLDPDELLSKSNLII